MTSEEPSSKRIKTAESTDMIICDNYIGGQFVPPTTKEYMDVMNPADNSKLGSVALSSAEDVEIAIKSATEANAHWSSITTKARAAIMFKFHELVATSADELADLVVAENGKNRAEALASIAKGNETVEWACSLPEVIKNSTQEVSRGVTCRESKDPLGVVACIVPFNFPIMVPMWTIPIALTAGNCVILKPSEKVPCTMTRVAALLKQAGLPDGVFQIVHGTKPVVEALCDSPSVKAVTFVGSSPVAEIVADRCHRLNKRVLALGGAKNHLVALPDCDPDMAAQDIVASFAGCAGQRCMAASVLILVVPNYAPTDGAAASPASDDDSVIQTHPLLQRICARARALSPGLQPGQVGAIIERASRDRILGYIDGAAAEKGSSSTGGSSSVDVLVDGRAWAKVADRAEGGMVGGGGEGGGEVERTCCKGNWVGPTVLYHRGGVSAVLTPSSSSPSSTTPTAAPLNGSQRAFQHEIFGPVLSVIAVPDWATALAVEAASPFGNAASIYTASGHHADYFAARFTAGMVGVNIGVPVPREPFSFGGKYGTKSKFGDFDITGDGGLEFFTTRRKVTAKWAYPASAKATATATATAAASSTPNGVASSGAAAGGDGGDKSDRANFAGQM